MIATLEFTRIDRTRIAIDAMSIISVEEVLKPDGSQDYVKVEYHRTHNIEPGYFQSGEDYMSVIERIKATIEAYESLKMGMDDDDDGGEEFPNPFSDDDDDGEN